MPVASDGAKAWEVANKFEPKIAAALETALTLYSDSVSVSRIQAYITNGDLNGLLRYLDARLVGDPRQRRPDRNPRHRRLRGGAGGGRRHQRLPRQVRHHRRDSRSRSGRAPWRRRSCAPAASAPFAFNPVNPATIRAVKLWQGNLIQQMDESARKNTMAIIEDGLIRGQSPRTTARTIKASIGLTDAQNKAVMNFGAELDRIVQNGMRSGRSWGLYTPNQIQSLKASDPKTYKRMNFTAREIKEGRRWGKISRASGTLSFDPKTGIKASKPIGFVNDKLTQGGENAFRIGVDGKPIDGMTQWRLRDKRLDPKIYDVVASEEALTAARASGDPKAIAKAEARREAALKALKADRDTMVDHYRGRYVKHRSQVIARTESMRASNLGLYESWRQASRTATSSSRAQVRRHWITAQDDRVRIDHRVAGQTYARGKPGVAMEEPFMVDGAAVMFPPAAPNCRCATAITVDLKP